eukprot:2516932-Rhodomonas_salina.1
MAPLHVMVSLSSADRAGTRVPRVLLLGLVVLVLVVVVVVEVLVPVLAGPEPQPELYTCACMPGPLRVKLKAECDGRHWQWVFRGPIWVPVPAGGYASMHRNSDQALGIPTIRVPGYAQEFLTR